jgi:sugar phosphate permease
MDFLRRADRRWAVFILACLISWLLYVHRYAWGVIKPALKAEYPEWTNAQLGLLDSLFNITYALGQIPGGAAGDVFGPRVVLTIMLVSWSGTVAALAGMYGFLQLAIVRAAFGLAQAGVYPNLSKVTQSWFAPAIRTTVQGVVASASGRAGGACASLIVATLLMGALGMGWRTSFVTIAAGGFVLALAFWVVFRDRPPEAMDVGTAQGATPAIAKPRPQIVWSPDSLITLGALMLYSACSTFADQLYVYWIPLFLEQDRGLSVTQMGVFAMLPLLGGALGGMVGGVLNDLLIRATGNPRLGRGAVALVGKLAGAGLLVASLYVADGRLVMVVLMVSKFFGDWSLTSQWGALTDIAGPASGTIFGIVNMSGSLAAFAAGPIMGYVTQEFGWGWLFAMVAIVYTAAALCWLVIDSTRRLVV